MTKKDGYGTYTVISIEPEGNRGSVLLHTMAFNGKLTRRMQIQPAFVKAKDFADFQAQVKEGDEIQVKIANLAKDVLGCATEIAGWRKIQP